MQKYNIYAQHLHSNKKKMPAFNGHFPLISLDAPNLGVMPENQNILSGYTPSRCSSANLSTTPWRSAA